MPSLKGAKRNIKMISNIVDYSLPTGQIRPESSSLIPISADGFVQYTKQQFKLSLYLI